MNNYLHGELVYTHPVGIPTKAQGTQIQFIPSFQ